MVSVPPSSVQVRFSPHVPDSAAYVAREKGIAPTMSESVRMNRMIFFIKLFLLIYFSVL